jgi:1A family penicillin-binding protein
MSVKKKSSSLKRNKKEISAEKRPSFLMRNFAVNAEKIGISVVLIYWTAIKWFILLFVKGGGWIFGLFKGLFAAVSKYLISLPYRSTTKKVAKGSASLGFKLVKLPFLIIFFPFKAIWWVLKKIYFFEIKFRLISFKFIFLGIILVGAYVVSLFYLTILKDLPSSNTLYKYDPNLTTRIYDRKGNLLYRLYFDEDRIPVSLSEMPQDFINATIAVEDEEFFSHHGFSSRGILRAAKRTFLEDDLEGGSTITQQLVKNLILTPDRTYERKIKEILLAVEVERRFTKEQILEMYLNNISFGGTSYGIKSAARKYFGKDLNELSLAESSFLAGLPAAPSVYSPYGSTPERGKDRQSEVLNRMVSAQFISQEQADQAYAEELAFIDSSTYMKYPHFVNYVIDELNSQYGQMFVAKGGLEVYTSIDPELQDATQEIVAKQVAALKRYQVKNGAVLITNPKTGEILAMVGSADYWNESIDGNVNVTTAIRQPGSSIKPFTYAIAIESGDTPYTLIEDKPIEYKLPNGDVYKPENYDGRFHGVMPLKSALANSYNIPAVKLADQIGVDELVIRAPDFGITTWTQPERYGLSITLGAAEVKMTEMAQLYSVFANGGERKDLDPILKIYDAYGNTVHENGCIVFDENTDTPMLSRKSDFEFKNDRALGEYNGIKPECVKERVISERTAYYITDMLSDNRARTPAFGGNSNLNIKAKQVAVKTGTTTSVRDNWAIGYTNDYVVLAWIGNNDNSKMGNIASGGSNSASSIWRETFNYVINNREVADKIDIDKPELVEVSICPITNTLSCDACKGIRQSFVKGDEPQTRCSEEEIRRIVGDNDDNDEDEDEDDEDQEEYDEGDYDYWLD